MFDWDSDLWGWTVDTTVMTGPGFRPLNLEVLWPNPMIRGENEERPGIPGRLDREHFPDETVRDLFFQLNGEVDNAGAPHVNRMVGLETNLATLYAVCRPPTSGNTRASALLMPSGATLETGVQLTASEPVKDGPLVRVVVTVKMPDGEHTEGGS